MWGLLGLAWALPDIDTPVTTGAIHAEDAAVIIGIEDYFLLPDVPHAQRDAAAFEGFVRHTRGIPSERVRVLGVGANREQMLDAVGTLAAQVGPKGTLWVYFAGHGAADPATGERILLGADAQADTVSFAARAVPVAELEALATSGGGHAMFLLDTCYSGRARGGGDLVDGKRLAVPSYAASVASQVTRWTAAGPTEWSSPLPGARHGAFTYVALGALRGWADADGDGQVTAQEAQAFATRTLSALQVTGQRPELQGDAQRVLSTATEEAPALEPAIYSGPPPPALDVPPSPVVARIEAGPGVDLSRRGPYTQRYRPKVGGLVWGLGLLAGGGFVAAQTNANFQRGEAETSGDWGRMLTFNILGGSTAILGGLTTGLSLLPDKRAPVRPVEGP